MARYIDVSSTLSASSAVCAIASAAVVRRRCHFVILQCEGCHVGLSPIDRVGTQQANARTLLAQDVIQWPQAKVSGV